MEQENQRKQWCLRLFSIMVMMVREEKFREDPKNKKWLEIREQSERLWLTEQEEDDLSKLAENLLNVRPELKDVIKKKLERMNIIYYCGYCSQPQPSGPDKSCPCTHSEDEQEQQPDEEQQNELSQFCPAPNIGCWCAWKLREPEKYCETCIEERLDLKYIRGGAEEIKKITDDKNKFLICIAEYVEDRWIEHLVQVNK